MNKVFEQIIEKLENELKLADEEKLRCARENHLQFDSAKGYANGVANAIEIVKQAAEQFCRDTNVGSNGWIPCSERLPEEYVPVNVTWINRNPESYYAKIKDVPFSATAVYCNSKWYWYSSTCVDYLIEYGENDFDLVDKDIDVIAWQPLPQPYQPKGE